MGFATYVAKDGLAPMHVANVTYTILFSVTKFDEQFETLRRRPRALAGNAETLYFGKIRKYAVTLLPVAGIDTKLVEEFLQSTASGQVFTFDPYGTPDAPVRSIQVDREDEGHAKQRTISTDDAMNADLFEYSFLICER